MDQIKIGKYIAEKRKALGLTQVELAEKLGMSNKSVSKWERGVCLPDVSVYNDLCSLLGISINEFLAGEDIEKDAIEKKSEENIISVTEAGNKRNRRIKSFSFVLGIIALILCAVLVSFMNKEGDIKSDYIEPYDELSETYQNARMIDPEGILRLYRVDTNLFFNNIQIKVYEYSHGTLISTNNSGGIGIPREESDGATEGKIAIVLKPHDRELRLICDTDYGSTSCENTVFSGAGDDVLGEWGIMNCGIEDKTEIELDREIPLCLFRISKELAYSTYTFEDVIENKDKVIFNDDWDILVTLIFTKE